MRLSRSRVGRRALAAAVGLVSLSPVAHAGAPPAHPNPEPIVVRVDDGFHWGDAGIGAAAGVGAGLVVAGALVVVRGGGRAAIYTSNRNEEVER